MSIYDFMKLIKMNLLINSPTMTTQDYINLFVKFFSLSSYFYNVWSLFFNWLFILSLLYIN